MRAALLTVTRDVMTRVVVMHLAGMMVVGCATSTEAPWLRGEPRGPVGDASTSDVDVPDGAGDVGSDTGMDATPACTPSGPGDPCTARDDDCDGTTDEGECSMCMPTGEGNPCTAADDDCDGTTDEGTCCVPTGPGDPCTGDDDDCDGTTDEGVCEEPCTLMGLGDPCTPADDDCDGVFDEGTCCVPSGLGDPCTAEDDDCDGTTDEGVCCVPTGVGDPCTAADDDCDGTTDEGMCCVPTGPGDPCTAVDDDCDGSTDEGVCCVPTGPGDPCTAEDDDCDGTTDEGTCAPLMGVGLEFDGADFVRIPRGMIPISSGPYTIEIWYSTTGIPSGTLFGNREFVPPDSVQGTAIHFLSMGRLALDAGGFRSIPSITPGPGTHHVAFARTSTGDFRVGSDGSAFTSSLTATESIATSSDFAIGARDDNGNDGFTGRIVRVRIWNIARSETQMEDVTEADATDTAGLIAEFDFHEGTGQSVGSVLGGVTGTLGQNSSADAADPTWITE